MINLDQMPRDRSRFSTASHRMPLPALTGTPNHRLFVGIIKSLVGRLKLHDKLASITPSEEQVESVNCRFQTVEDVATVFNLAGHDVGCKLLK